MWIERKSKGKHDKKWFEMWEKRHIRAVRASDYVTKDSPPAAFCARQCPPRYGAHGKFNRLSEMARSPPVAVSVSVLAVSTVSPLCVGCVRCCCVASQTHITASMQSFVMTPRRQKLQPLKISRTLCDLFTLIIIYVFLIKSIFLKINSNLQCITILYFCVF